MWNLPIHWLSKAVGFKLGQMFSAVKEVIIPPGGGKEGRHMKILAEVDISQPLARGTTIKFNGNPIWVEFRYEKCPDFCYKCGIIGHGDKNCKAMVGREHNQREEQFGTWMRAGNIMASPLRASRTSEGSTLEMVEPQKQKERGMLEGVGVRNQEVRMNKIKVGTVGELKKDEKSKEQNEVKKSKEDEEKLRKNEGVVREV